jgi:hypothetical protein
MEKWPDPVKMRVKKSGQMRTDYQPVERVGRQGNLKQPVLQITETVHNASSTNPVEMASSALKNKIITSLSYSRRRATPERFLAGNFRRGFFPEPRQKKRGR